MIVNPFNIFLFRQVFVSLPDDVYEAAQLDHCRPIKYFFTMVLPMSKSVVATVSVFTFLNVWNDYLWPSLVISRNENRTITLGIAALVLGENYTNPGLMMASTVVSVLPVMLIFMFANKYIVRGFTQSGIK